MRTRLLRGWSLTLALVGLLVIGQVSACTVSREEEGELPEVEVENDDGGMPEVDVDTSDANLPRLDVDWADVDVELTEITVDMPKVDVYTETERLQVPRIDLTWPNEDPEGSVERELTAEVEVSEPGYRLRIEEVYGAGDRLIVVARVDETSANTEHRRLSDRIVVKGPEMDVDYYLVTDRPEIIENEGDFTVITSRSEIDADLQEARELFTRG